jgi:hypothetical protein
MILTNLYKQFRKNVDDLDLAKANQIIAKYFLHLQFVLVGKADEIKTLKKNMVK